MAYLALPIVNAITPLMVLPVITSSFGDEGLGTYGLALSLGTSASLFAELGWGIVGPQRIAAMDSSGRRQYYLSSVATKFVTVPISMIAITIIALLLNTRDPFTCCLMAYGFLFGAFSPSWFFYGKNTPLQVFLIEGLPKLAFYASSAIGMMLGLDLVSFGIATIAAPVTTYLLFAKRERISLLPRRQHFDAGISILREQIWLTTGRGVSVVYTSLPTTLVTVFAPLSAPAFIALDRLVRMSNSILTGVHNRFQSWIGHAGTSLRMRRILYKQILFSLLIALASLLGFAILCIPVAQFVYVGKVPLTESAAIAGGTLLFALTMSRAFGLCLVAIRSVKAITVSNFAAAIVGIIGIPICCTHFGYVGAYWAVVAAESTNFLVQAILYRLISAKSRVAR